MKSKREIELEKCLGKTLKLLKGRRPYLSNRDVIKGCTCMPCCDQRELNTAINRIRRVLKDGE